ncbi:MAG TPA: FeoB-associated Cys-rich membrane protein [Candidatus Avibacteroides avistercoris]|uniref:FeoB-associated Cys-rich membrane protein n=1 Tax=Candidatus Avibacteroides avistercoris TaxID=2840690 RepID=A0A9D2UI43_9BACT|nr:FeoB-associated Cys-rich membrane protein [Candidatus Avibacteroides avistercoris]
MWQDIAVCAIVVACVVWAVLHFGRFFSHRKGKSPCDGCTSDCKLRGRTGGKGKGCCG